MKKLNQDLAQIKTIGQLLDYISESKISFFAQILLIIWGISPLLVLLFSISLPHGDMFTQISNQNSLAIFWQTILWQTGYCGLFIGLVLIGKSLLEKKKNNISPNDYIKTHLFPLMLGLMLLWSILATVFAENPTLALQGHTYRKDGLLAYFAYAGLFCCGMALFQKKHILRVIKVITATAAILSIVTIINLEMINQLFHIDARTSVFHNSNHYGYYLCVTLGLALLLILNSKQKIPFVSYILFVIITAALVINRSIGPYLGVWAGMIVCIVIYTFIRKERTFKIRSITSAILLLLVSIIVNTTTAHLGSDLYGLLQDGREIFYGTELAARAGSGRWRLWVNAVSFIGEKPLFGYGPDNLGERYAALGIGIDRPHNELLQFAASLGIPAMVFYITALAVQLKNFWINRYKLSAASIGLFSALFAYLVSSMFGNTMYYTSPFFFLLLGMSWLLFRDTSGDAADDLSKIK